MDMLNETTQQTTDTNEEALPMPAAKECPDAPFRAECNGEVTHHATVVEALFHVSTQLDAVHVVVRRDVSARRLGVWRDEYDVTREPDATITWPAGAKV